MATILTLMGFDPTRKQHRRPTDLLFVGAAVVVLVIALAWAIFG